MSKSEDQFSSLVKEISGSSNLSEKNFRLLEEYISKIVLIYFRSKINFSELKNVIIEVTEDFYFKITSENSSIENYAAYIITMTKNKISRARKNSLNREFINFSKKIREIIADISNDDSVTINDYFLSNKNSTANNICDEKLLNNINIDHDINPDYFTADSKEKIKKAISDFVKENNCLLDIIELIKKIGFLLGVTETTVYSIDNQADEDSGGNYYKRTLSNTDLTIEDKLTAEKCVALFFEKEILKKEKNDTLLELKQKLWFFRVVRNLKLIEVAEKLNLAREQNVSYYLTKFNIDEKLQNYLTNCFIDFDNFDEMTQHFFYTLEELFENEIGLR